MVNDSFGNKFNLSTFSFDINEKILKAEKITLSDEKANSVFVKNGYVNLKSGELVGSDFNLNLSKDFFGNPENDPRLIGRYIITNKSETNQAFVDVKVTTDGGSTFYHVAKKVNIPPSNTLTLDKPINLESNDVLRVIAHPLPDSSSISLEAYASILEIS